MRRQGWEGVFTFSLEVETYTGVVLSNRMQVGHEVAAVLQAGVQVLRDGTWLMGADACDWLRVPGERLSEQAECLPGKDPPDRSFASVHPRRDIDDWGGYR